MNKVPSFVWIILTIIIGAGFLLLLSQNRNNATPKQVNLPVEVEVYSDYNCPHCADFSPYVLQVEEKFGDKVNLQKKHLPFLADTSYTYAYAAEAAREQGKFDDFDREMFRWSGFGRNQNNANFQYTDEEKTFYAQAVDIEKLAERLELDLEKFNEDRESQTIIDKVQQQKTDIVRKLGTQSTPTVLIYGEEFKLTAFEDLSNKVEELITLAESKPEE